MKKLLKSEVCRSRKLCMTILLNLHFTLKKSQQLQIILKKKEKEKKKRKKESAKRERAKREHAKRKSKPHQIKKEKNPASQSYVVES